MKKIFFNIISLLMLTATASAQFVITDAEKQKTNVDGNLTFTQNASSWTAAGKDVSKISYITL